MIHTSTPRFGLIAPLVAPAESGAMFGSLTATYRQLIERADARGWESYVFSLRDVLRQRASIWAWVRNHDTWERRFVAPPHVVATRMMVTTAEERAILLWLRSEANVQFINQPEIHDIVEDSWRLLQILQSHPTLNANIPESGLLRDTQSYTTLLASSVPVQITPRFSLASQGKIHVARTGEQYLVRHERAKTGTTLTFASPADVATHVTLLFGEAIGSTYAEPLRLEGCAVFVREFWQRDRTGRWQETCAVLRIGQPHSQTYQAVTAGIFDDYQAALKPQLGARLKAVRYGLRNVSRSVVDLLSQRGHGAGELAVDFVITGTGTIQLVGVTTQGGVESVTRLMTPTLRQRTLSTMLDYASALYQQQQTTVPTASPVETG